MDKMVRATDTWEVEQSSKRSDKEMYNKIWSALGEVSVSQILRP